MTRRYRGLAASIVVAALVLSACGAARGPAGSEAGLAGAKAHVDAGPSVEPAPKPTAGLHPGPHDSISADARRPLVPVFKKPHKGRPFATIENPDEYGSRPSFLVKEVRGRWYEAYLPMRPNGVTGWIRARDVHVRVNPYRIEVDLSANRLEVFEGGKRLMRESVATGTGGTPTPTGLFYTTILVKPPDPGGAYGPYAYGLSAYSEVLFSFGGGDGQVAIHGTNDPSSIGNDVSHGCVRMNNDAIVKLAKFLPLGTPVRIKR